MSLNSQLIDLNGNLYVQEVGSMKAGLPLGVYNVLYDEHKARFYLHKNSDDFVLPEKIYNNPTPLINRWMKSWRNCKGNMGILLSGVKGGGKTITAKMLCNMAQMPVVCITNGYTSDSFKDFLASSVFENCIVFIDEFEKVYDHHDENADNSVENLLTLFEGAYSTRLLFLLTSNNNKLSEFFMNRPGRIKYHTEYGYMTPKEAEEVVEDLLENQEHAGSIYKLLNYYGNCTMDILMKLIEDMNMFQEDAQTCARFLNLKPDIADFHVYLQVENQMFKAGSWYDIKLEDREIYESIRVDSAVGEDLVAAIMQRAQVTSSTFKETLENILVRSTSNYDILTEKLTYDENHNHYIYKNFCVGKIKDNSIFVDLILKPMAKYNYTTAMSQVLA